MRVLLCAVALTTAVAYVGASPLLGAKVVHENASPFGTRFNFGTGTTTAAATSAEHVHNQQFRPKRNMQQQHHPVHLFRPVRQNPSMMMAAAGVQQGGNPAGVSAPPMGGMGMNGMQGGMGRPPASPVQGKDGLFFQDVSVGGGFGGFGGGIGPGFGLGFGGFGGFPGFGGFGGFGGFPGFGFGGFPGFGFGGPFGGFGLG